jgi:flagellar motor switch protein FliN/FliY
MPQLPDEAGAQTVEKKADDFAQFLNVPLSIRVEVGRRNMKVRDLLTLRPEFIVALPKSAGDNVEVFANGTLIAYGEVVEMEGSAGVRITDLYEPT